MERGGRPVGKEYLKRAGFPLALEGEQKQVTREEPNLKR
jgi:hypothetical protein